MKRHLNTLFITTQGAYAHKEGATVAVSIDDSKKVQIPLANLEGIVAFGRVSLSPFLLGACAELGVSVSLLTERGRFLAAVNGYQSGNVLLRREQYRRADRLEDAARIAASMIAAKLANARSVLARAARDHGDESGALGRAVRRLGQLALKAADSNDLDALRGFEGEGAGAYYDRFSDMITLADPEAKEVFAMRGRNRRPPLDCCNALLSFIYTLLMGDCRAAAEGTGLDSQVGFLHRDRPGRPSLALDLMEEFRAILADRLVLSLINRQQIKAGDFEVQESGATYLTESGRKTVLVAWQKRKDDIVRHPFLDERMTVGLFPHMQARLLARHLRGDLDAYPALIWE